MRNGGKLRAWFHPRREALLNAEGYRDAMAGFNVTPRRNPPTWNAAMHDG